MTKIRGERIYHATKPGTLPDDENTYEKKNKKITTKQLIKSYLCDGERSRCVALRECECLDVCQYGRRYIQQTSEEKS